jgi:DeoR/GlpR family transcriptional regulator of sugar metabolism
MKPRDRQAKIAAIIGQEGQASVDALALRFDVSAETVRRDLTQLAESGLVQKVHGGAKRPRLHAEASFLERMSEDADAKQEIGRKLRALVEPGDTVFIDTGSTTLICAAAVADIGGLTVVTNSAEIARTMAQGAADNAIYLLGGRYGADNSETLGPIAIEQIATFQADSAILTVAAVDADAGIMDADIEEAQVARAMIANAQQVIIVANATKLGRRAAFRVCDLGSVDVLVSDQPPSIELATALVSAGVELR